MTILHGDEQQLLSSFRRRNGNPRILVGNLEYRDRGVNLGKVVVVVVVVSVVHLLWKCSNSSVTCF